jgi:flavodoxin
MKSSIVIYEHEDKMGKACAKNIAYHLGAQTTCTHHVPEAILSNVDNFILCISTWRPTGERGQWTEILQSLASHRLDGKSFAFFFCHDPEAGAFIFDGLDRFYDLLRQQGARVVGSPEWHKRNATITDWICMVSPNL